MTKEVKAALIGGICTIIAATIGIFSININIDKKEPEHEYENFTHQKQETDSNTSYDSHDKKVSIFDLETFKGEGGWHKSTDDIDYTDTYDNEYPTSYWGKHYAISENIKNSMPIYLLDNKYSICEGQMAWSKGSKNIEGSAWLEFYSGDECIYTTEPISADSKILDFNFSVEGVEKLTIVRNATKDMNDWDTIHIVYPYLNIIE